LKFISKLTLLSPYTNLNSIINVGKHHLGKLTTPLSSYRYRYANYKYVKEIIYFVKIKITLVLIIYIQYNISPSINIQLFQNCPKLILTLSFFSL